MYGLEASEYQRRKTFCKSTFFDLIRSKTVKLLVNREKQAECKTERKKGRQTEKEKQTMEQSERGRERDTNSERRKGDRQTVTER